MRVWRWLRGTFLAGLVALLPLGLTAFVLWLLYRWAYGLFGPHTALASLMRRTIGIYIPGTEIIAGLLVILLVGIVARHWLGKTILSAMERALLRVPFIRKLYWTGRQLARYLFQGNKAPTGRVVLVEFPGPGSYVLGMLTADEAKSVGQSLGQEVSAVYIPTAPNPLTGWVLFLPKERLIPTNLTMDEGLTLVLSGGLLVKEEGNADSSG
jgi:uncharacterized membrane protein